MHTQCSQHNICMSGVSTALYRMCRLSTAYYIVVPSVHCSLLFCICVECPPHYLSYVLSVHCSLLFCICVECPPHYLSCVLSVHCSLLFCICVECPPHYLLYVLSVHCSLLFCICVECPPHYLSYVPSVHCSTIILYMCGVSTTLSFVCTECPLLTVILYMCGVSTTLSFLCAECPLLNFYFVYVWSVHHIIFCMCRVSTAHYYFVRGAFGKFLAIDKPYHVWYHFKELSVFFVIAHISWGCHDAITKNIIVNTCTVCILEKAKFQWKI